MGAEALQSKRSLGRFAPSTTGHAHPGTLLAALLFCLDFMRFTQTRIATIDTYSVFFILTSYVALLAWMRRDPLREGRFAESHAGFQKLFARGKARQTGKAISVEWADVFAVADGVETLCATALVTIRNSAPPPARAA